MPISQRFPMANGACPPWQLARAGLLVLPVLLAVPAIAQTPIPSPAYQVPDLLHAGTRPSDPSPATNPAENASTPADSPDTTREMRGLWVVRDSLASPASIHQVVLTAVKYHLNALFVQVRGRGDALYNSPYEPRSEVLAHQPKDFDPLQQVIAEAHASGLQVHAWMNTFLTWSGSRAPYSPQHLWNAHRDWFACDRHGHCTAVPTNACEGAFLQPSNPAVQEHLFNVYTYVASHYDVDGIHFDYCRYAGSDYDFSGSTLARFRDYMATQVAPEEIAQIDTRRATDRLAYVHAFAGPWADWRRAQITDLVARISAAVKADKPWVQVSAAVFPNADEAFSERGQDWRDWLKTGSLDAVALMAYGTDTQRVLALTRQAIAVAGASHVYTGIGAWHLSAHDVAHKIAEVRKTGAAGVNLFSYGGVHDRPRYLDTLARGVFASRAAPPAFRRPLRSPDQPDRSGPVDRTPAGAPAPGTSTGQAGSQ